MGQCPEHREGRTIPDLVSATGTLDCTVCRKRSVAHDAVPSGMHARPSPRHALLLAAPTEYKGGGRPWWIVRVRGTRSTYWLPARTSDSPALGRVRTRRAVAHVERRRNGDKDDGIHVEIGVT